MHSIGIDYSSSATQTKLLVVAGGGSSCTTTKQVEETASLTGERVSITTYPSAADFNLLQYGCCTSCTGYRLITPAYEGSPAGTDSTTTTNSQTYSGYPICSASGPTSTTSTSPVLSYALLFRANPSTGACEAMIQVYRLHAGGVVGWVNGYDSETGTHYGGFGLGGGELWETGWIPLSSLVGTHTLTFPQDVSSVIGGPPYSTTTTTVTGTTTIEITIGST